MRQPLWIVNSTLLALFLLGGAIMYLNRPETPERQEIMPEGPIIPKPRVSTKINISEIYDNDLFDTYQPPMPDVEKPDYAPTMPPAPLPNPIQMPHEGPPEFLDPLPIRVTGIIMLGDELKDVVMITNITSKEEISYHVGDKIKDAQLIRILKNRIIMIRSNGQQEILFLRKLDATHAQQKKERNWTDIIKKVTSTRYKIDPDQFGALIANLGNVVDQLDLTTAYKNGKSIGCRIGISGPQTLAEALGLKAGDIIQHIDSLPAFTTDDRLAIYDHLIKLKVGDSFILDFLRKNRKKLYTINLETIGEKPGILDQETGIMQLSDRQIEEEKIKLLKEQHRFAPTFDQLQAQERKAMIQHGKQNNMRKFKTRNRLSN